MDEICINKDLRLTTYLLLYKSYLFYVVLLQTIKNNNSQSVESNDHENSAYKTMKRGADLSK